MNRAEYYERRQLERAMLAGLIPPQVKYFEGDRALLSRAWYELFDAVHPHLKLLYSTRPVTVWDPMTGEQLKEPGAFYFNMTHATKRTK